MAARTAVPSVVLGLSELIWHRTRMLRGRLHHGVRQCPQQLDPLHPANDAALCARCSELLGETLIVTANRLASVLETGYPDDQLIETTTYRACRWMKDARDRLDAGTGLMVRPKRLKTRRWFIQVVPDPIDREIVIDVLFFARSGNESMTHEIPVEHLAARFELTTRETAVRLTLTLTELRTARPGFLETNLDTPLIDRALAQPFEVRAQLDGTRIDGHDSDIEPLSADSGKFLGEGKSA